MRRPPLTPSVVRGLFIISGHADAAQDDYCFEHRDGLSELQQGAAYLRKLIRWYQSHHQDFDVQYQTPEQPN